jgi:hypothetical protein
MHADEFRRCLLELDVPGIRQIWRHVAPHLPHQSDDQILATLHAARTQANSIPHHLRFYSHQWLSERDLPSGLPDELRPLAQRMYPRTVSAVGIGVRSLFGKQRPLAAALEAAMADAVREAYAEGKTDPAFVRARMQEARNKILKG